MSKIEFPTLTNLSLGKIVNIKELIILVVSKVCARWTWQVFEHYTYVRLMILRWKQWQIMGMDYWSQLHIHLNAVYWLSALYTRWRCEGHHQNCCFNVHEPWFIVVNIGMKSRKRIKQISVHKTLKRKHTQLIVQSGEWSLNKNYFFFL